MRKMKLPRVIFTAVFMLVSSSRVVFGAEGELSKKAIPLNSESEYGESKLAIPPDSESDYEESLFRIVEEKGGVAGEKAKVTQPKEDVGNNPDQSLLDLKLRLLEEQQQRLQRTIAEDSQR